jgi:hypothetical protein
VSAAISASTSLSSGVTGLTAAGNYVFELKATDDNGLSNTDAVTIIVLAAVPPANVPPTVNAGSDQIIQLPVSGVTLTGTATGNGGATISTTVWTEVSGPVTGVIANATILSAAVTGLTTAGTYVFELKATDNNGLSSTAAMTVTVQAAPVQNVPPVANAGPDQTVTMPVVSVTLDGSASYDPDGTITTYSWMQLTGNSGAMISAANQAQATLTGLKPGTYTFQLTVTDNAGATGVASVTVTVKAPPPSPLPPVADAGADTTIAIPADSTVLNGSASTDPGGQQLTYRWTEVSGPAAAAIGSPGNALTMAGGLTPGLYVFSLTVTNMSGLSATATVQVRVINNQRSTAADTGSSAFTIYPNPVESTVTVRFNNPNTVGRVSVRMFDMQGRMVVTGETEVSNGAEPISFNVSGLARGVYALEVVVGKSRSDQIVVKQ